MRKFNRLSRQRKVSEHSRFLTPGELCAERLRLAAELVALVHEEEENHALPQTLRTGLQSVSLLLAEVLALARRLP